MSTGLPHIRLWISFKDLVLTRGVRWYTAYLGREFQVRGAFPQGVAFSHLSAQSFPGGPNREIQVWSLYCRGFITCLLFRWSYKASP